MTGVKEDLSYLINESPLKLDKAYAKEYKFPKEAEPDPIQKLGYLQEQLGQLHVMYWRARVDMLHSARLQQEENPTLREKGLSNMATHRNEAQQFVGAIVMLRKLIEELRAEYPELQVEG